MLIKDEGQKCFSLVTLYYLKNEDNIQTKVHDKTMKSFKYATCSILPLCVTDDKALLFS